MKIERIKIHNFKRFDDLEISFENSLLAEISDRYLILGDNGTGKTTLLQAIALPLALATRQINSINEFNWSGFIPGRYYKWGKPLLELNIEFEDAELEKTIELAERWNASLPPEQRDSFIKPSRHKHVTLTLDGENCRARTRNEYFQFRGRWYASRLLVTDSEVRKSFYDLPGIFWFDQFRNLSISMNDLWGSDIGDTGSQLRPSGVASLREYLNGWYFYSKLAPRPPVEDYFEELHSLYRRVFPTRSFYGIEPMPGLGDIPAQKDYYFLLNDGLRTYDLEEMSSGEQNVFPILYEFVRKRIGHSIVLIDEVDLNLHPPAAQTLVSQLPFLGATCQFILTTHSDAVSDMISNEVTYRLPGGSLCL